MTSDRVKYIAVMLLISALPVVAQDEIITLSVGGGYDGGLEEQLIEPLKLCGYGGFFLPWANVKAAKGMPKITAVARRHGMQVFIQHQLWEEGGIFVDQDGKIIKTGVHCGCPNNEKWRNSCMEIMKTTGKDFSQEGVLFWNNHYWYAVNDEWHYPYNTKKPAYACYCEGCQKRWPVYLKEMVYRDQSPSADSSGDGRTLKGDTGESYDAWEKVPLPKFSEHDQKKYLWYLFHNFRAWSYVNYLKELRDAMRPFNMYPACMLNASGAHPDDAVKSGLDAAQWVDVNDMIVIEQHGADHPVHRFAINHWNTLNRIYGKPVMKINHAMYQSRMESPHPFWRRPSSFGPEKNAQCSGSYVSRLYARCLALDHLKFIAEYAIGYTALSRSITYTEGTYKTEQGEKHCGLNWFPYPNLYKDLIWWIHFYRVHGKFLSESTAMRNATVGVFFPWAGGLWGDAHLTDLKYDCEWGAWGLFADHMDVSIISETDLLKGGKENASLKSYKVVYFFSTKSIPVELVDKIKDYHRNGGWLFADGDSLTEILPGALQRENLLESLFLVKLDEGVQEGGGEIEMITDDILPKGTRVNVCGKIRTATVVDPVKTRVLAAYNGKPVMVQGERTIWSGFLPGVNVFGFAPARYLDTEPVDLYKTNDKRKGSLMDMQALLKLAAYPAIQAGSEGMVKVYREGMPAHNVEVIHRYHEKTGLTLIAFINHENVPDGFYKVKTDYKAPNHIVWDLTLGQKIKDQADGEFPVVIDDNAVTLVLIGPEKEVKAFIKNHDRLNALKSPQWYEIGKWYEDTYKVRFE